MNSTPKISVIVPVFNNAQYLHECIDSIIGQTLHNIEIILINDGSTDPAAPAILDDYAKKDSRVRVIHKDNGGTGHTWNTGLKVARGEYIGFVDADDYIMPSMYSELYRCALQNDCDIVKCNFIKFYKYNDLYAKNKINIFNYRNCYNRIIFPKLEHNVFFSIGLMWNGIYRKKMIADNDISFLETRGAAGQDCGFFFKTLASCSSFYCIDEYHYMWRMINDSSSKVNTSKDNVYCTFTENRSIAEFLTSRGLGDHIGFQKMHMYKQFLNYRTQSKRICDDFKFEYYNDVKAELLSPYKNGIFDKGVFNTDWFDAMKILHHTGRYIKYMPKKHNEPLLMHEEFANLLINTGRLIEAESLLLNLYQSDNNIGWIAFLMAKVCIREHRYDEAFTYLKEAISLYDDDFSYKEIFSDILRRKHNLMLGIKYLQSTLEVNDDWGAGWSRLSSLYDNVLPSANKR